MISWLSNLPGGAPVHSWSGSAHIAAIGRWLPGGLWNIKWKTGRSHIQERLWLYRVAPDPFCAEEL